MTETLTDALALDRVGLWGLLDIAIVSVLIYELLKVVRRTHAVQIFVGGGLVIGLYYASQFTPLQTTHWLIRDMFGYIVFAAIVIFQAGDGTLSVTPASEYDGDMAAIVHEIDPFAP